MQTVVSVKKPTGSGMASFLFVLLPSPLGGEGLGVRGPFLPSPLGGEGLGVRGPLPPSPLGGEGLGVRGRRFVPRTHARSIQGPPPGCRTRRCPRRAALGTPSLRPPVAACRPPPPCPGDSRHSTQGSSAPWRSRSPRCSQQSAFDDGT